MKMPQVISSAAHARNACSSAYSAFTRVHSSLLAAASCPGTARPSAIPATAFPRARHPSLIIPGQAADERYLASVGDRREARTSPVSRRCAGHVTIQPRSLRVSAETSHAIAPGAETARSGPRAGRTPSVPSFRSRPRIARLLRSSPRSGFSVGTKNGAPRPSASHVPGRRARRRAPPGPAPLPPARAYPAARAPPSAPSGSSRHHAAHPYHAAFRQRTRGRLRLGADRGARRRWRGLRCSRSSQPFMPISRIDLHSQARLRRASLSPPLSLPILNGTGHRRGLDVRPQRLGPGTNAGRPSEPGHYS